MKKFWKIWTSPKTPRASLKKRNQNQNNSKNKNKRINKYNLRKSKKKNQNQNGQLKSHTPQRKRFLTSTQKIQMPNWSKALIFEQQTPWFPNLSRLSVPKQY